MTISMYQVSIPRFVHMLNNLAVILDKAQAHVDAGHIDMASLMALSLFVFAELIVLIFGLWLLFRTTQAATEFPQSATE